MTTTTWRSAPRRGLAALSVVMVLFFVMALVAAYTNRNLVFEQRISANHYRAARALAAADGGVDWVLAMLNGGRIGLDCRPSTNGADNDFRSRYLKTDGGGQAVLDGGYELVTWGGVPGDTLYPACVTDRDGVQTCACPTVDQPTITPAAPGDGVGSSHRIAFQLPGNAVRPGAIEFAVRGCASPGSGSTACFAPAPLQRPGRPVVDALTTTLTTAGLVRALPVLPPATLTAGGQVSAGNFLQVSNADAGSGITVHAGQAVDATGSTFQPPAGSAGNGVRAGDTALAAQAAVPQTRWYPAVFGMDAATYRRQPAVVRLACGGGCARGDLDAALAGHPRNPIWVDGDLTLATAGALGSAADPLMLVVTGTLTVSADVDITGFVHAGSVNWTAGADLASVRGAVMVLNNFTATATATLGYDRPVLSQIRLRYGSFVRVPGSWNLAPADFD